MTLAIFGLTTMVSAAMTPISPGSGTVSPGGSVTAEFTLTSTLATCVVATVSPMPGQFSVTFDGLGLELLPANCGLDETDVEMTVKAAANASPGEYEVTITEVALLGGALLNTHQWPFTVEAPPTTSTTTSTTATSTTSTTAPEPTSSTTIPAGTTTSTSPATTTTESRDIIQGPAEPAGSEPDVTTSTVPESTTSTDPDGDESQVTPGRSGPGGGATAELQPRADPPPVAAESVAPLSDRLRTQLAAAVPIGLARAVMSPFAIAEFLFRSVRDNALALAAPLLITSLLGAGTVWRMRREVTDDELWNS